MDSPPRLIYRDYDSEARSRSFKSKGTQSEAEIIISPTTGIILTTSQAMSQLYLPGHKPSISHLNNVKGINSPLRERIIVLAPRYEQLYVFLCHPMATTKRSKSKLTGEPTADKRTLTSLVSLTAFCNSASSHSTIIPLCIPSAPEKVAEWILALAHKHMFQLPDINAASFPTIGFTPINPSHKANCELMTGLENETQWEVFLRRAGLNPFAAQAVLAVLRKQEKGMLTTAQWRGNTERVGGLSRFIEMPAELRERHFAGLTGRKVLKRLEGIIDKDWQCDWALDFDANGGM